MDFSLSEIGKRIKILIRENNYTEAKLAEELNIELHELLEILDGKKEISIEQILIITRIFNLSIEECVKTFFRR